MKLAIFSIAPSPYQRDLFCAIAGEIDIQLNVFYWERQTPDSPWRIDDLFPHEKILESRIYSFFGKRIHWSRKLPKTREYDAIIINGYLNIGILGFLMSNRGSAPILFFGERFTESKSKTGALFRELLRLPLKRIHAAIAIGKLAETQYSRIFTEKPILNQPYVINSEPYKKSKVSNSESPINILFCGQMIHRKGIDILLKAFEGILKCTLETEIRLILVGRSDNFENLIQTVNREAQRHIQYLGFREPSSLPNIFANASIFVLPSRYDGWGVVINQAIAAGLPIIASDQVGAAHDFVDRRNGRIIPADDVKALQSALIDLIKNRDKWKEISDYNHRLSDQLSPQDAAKNIIGFIKSLLKDR